MKDLTGPRDFATTHWSLVLAANPDEASRSRARAALAELCRSYWYPLYAFVRRTGADPDEAMDLTQGFFAEFLEKDFLADVDRARTLLRARAGEVSLVVTSTHNHEGPDMVGIWGASFIESGFDPVYMEWVQNRIAAGVTGEACDPFDSSNPTFRIEIRSDKEIIVTTKYRGARLTIPSKRNSRNGCAPAVKRRSVYPRTRE